MSNIDDARRSEVVFDGSTNPGTVIFRDWSGAEVRMCFQTDTEAKLAYGFLLDCIEARGRAESDARKIVEAMRAAMKRMEDVLDD